SLVPFYKLFEDRYTVYWRIYTPDAWEKKKNEDAAADARRKEIEQRTVDEVLAGERKSEAEHHLQGDTTMGGYYEGQGWRESRNGWFSYDLRIGAGKPVTLVCTYQGSEGQRRVFDVLVDGVNVGTQSMANHPTESFDVEYALPGTLTKGKSSITVEFRAQPQAMTGSVLDVRVVQ
ncbi:MAG TPA: DUF6805 domain-containing protein, partial [Bacteroidota bacterium]